MHCNILQLDSPPTTISQVTRAFKKQAMRWHPDKHMGKPIEIQRRAEARMMRINAAVDFFHEYLEQPPLPLPLPASPPPPPPPPSPAIAAQMQRMWAADIRKLTTTFPQMKLREQTFIVVLKAILVNGLAGCIPNSLDQLFGVVYSRQIVEAWFLNKTDISRNPRIADLIINNKENQYDIIRAAVPRSPSPQELETNNAYVCYCIGTRLNAYRDLLKAGIAPHSTELKVVRWALTRWPCSSI